MKKLVLSIALGLGFLSANSQIVSPIVDGSLGIIESSANVSHIEVKEEGGGLILTTGVAAITEATNNLPSGSYNIEIVYINNTRKTIEYHK